MITLIGGEKGGTGKTTVLVNLASLAAADGADLIVVDTDRQRSAALFFATRNENGIEPYVPCIEKRGKSLGRDLRSLGEKYSLVLVDAGGQDSMELRYALSVADEAYIPVQPAQADLWTLDKMSELVDEAGAFNDRLIARTLLNRCSTNPRNSDAEEAREVLESYNNLTPLNIGLKERVAFQRIFRNGQGVSEYDKDSHSAKEIEDLYREVFYG